MHELGRYLQREMDRREWKPSDLISRSGLSKQTVYNLLNDTRERMDQTPQRKTVVGLSKALGVSEQAVLIASARAIGVPPRELPHEVDPAELTDDQLTAEIGRRLNELRQEVARHDNETPMNDLDEKRRSRDEALRREGIEDPPEDVAAVRRDDWQQSGDDPVTDND